MDDYIRFKENDAAQIENCADENRFAVISSQSDKYGGKTEVRQEYHLLALQDEITQIKTYAETQNALWAEMIASREQLIKDAKKAGAEKSFEVEPEMLVPDTSRP
jgi:hypothetical protein